MVVKVFREAGVGFEERVGYQLGLLWERVEDLNLPGRRNRWKSEIRDLWEGRFVKQARLLLEVLNFRVSFVVHQFAVVRLSVLQHLSLVTQLDLTYLAL